MRQQLVGICVLSLALMTSPLASFAQQEIASDAGEVVLDATVNTIDVENQLLTVTGPDGNTIAVKAPPRDPGSR
jgi:hypothetical protein